MIINDLDRTIHESSALFMGYFILGDICLKKSSPVAGTSSAELYVPAGDAVLFAVIDSILAIIRKRKLGTS